MQQVKENVAPRSLLQPGDVPGYPTWKRPEFHEYPKALTPPTVTVSSEMEERRLRSRWNQPLPYLENPEKVMIEKYYAEQVYPKQMQPPQVIVNSPEEESGILAGWQRSPDAQSAASDPYPKFLFHPFKPAQMVRNKADEDRLGPGWFPTIAEAVEAAQPVSAPEVLQPQPQDAKAKEAPLDAADKMTRTEMFEYLHKKGIEARVPITNEALRTLTRDAMKGE